jgi:transcriptional regulator with XRE-family HTH domain
VRCHAHGLLAILRGMARDIRRQLANRIRELRAEHEMTQQALAEAAGIDYKSVQRLEAKHPQFYPKLDTLESLAKAFKISASELIRF